jgi:hypothetical protein
VNRKDTANNILVDLDAESQRDLLGDAGTTPVRITACHCDDGVDEVFVRSLRARPMPALACKHYAVLSFCPAHEESAQTGDDPIACAQGRKR